jgi:hybrid cluster-associated redox disulfide protein
MKSITKDTLIGDALMMDGGIAPILMGAGMECIFCPSAAGETIEQAAMVHGINPDDLLEDIQDYLSSQG